MSSQRFFRRGSGPNPEGSLCGGVTPAGDGRSVAHEHEEAPGTHPGGHWPLPGGSVRSWPRRDDVPSGVIGSARRCRPAVVAVVLRRHAEVARRNVISAAGPRGATGAAHGPGHTRRGQWPFRLRAQRCDRSRRRGRRLHIGVPSSGRRGPAAAVRSGDLPGAIFARSVNDTIQIQNQLGQVTGQIEELKGQISYFDHSTTYATVSVTIRETTGGPKDEWGLQSAVNQAAHNFVNMIDFLVLALGALAPVLSAGLVLGWATWRGFLRCRRQQSTPAPSR